LSGITQHYTSSRTPTK